MVITFLIGNGFDRNLGLATTYSEFVKVYKNTKGKTKVLQNFREYINQDEDLWSSAEIALGQYTKEFESGDAPIFSECHQDICENLAEYLKEQQERIDYNLCADKIREAFSALNSISHPFPTTEKNKLNDTISNHDRENTVFQFICFNYTNTLDKCIELILEQSPNLLGSHQSGNKVLNHSITRPLHVHGTVDKEMVFGVNDDSQIVNNDLFECENGDLYKNILIKQSANASYMENTDARVVRMLNCSHIIYVYGMSLGATDKLWWERICNWLNSNSDHHLIIQEYAMPEKGVFQTPYQIAERNCRKKLTQYCGYDAPRKRNIESRIHITGSNLFEQIKNIASLTEEDHFQEYRNEVISEFERIKTAQQIKHLQQELDEVELLR